MIALASCCSLFSAFTLIFLEIWLDCECFSDLGAGFWRRGARAAAAAAFVARRVRPGITSRSHGFWSHSHRHWCSGDQSSGGGGGWHGRRGSSLGGGFRCRRGRRCRRKEEGRFQKGETSTRTATEGPAMPIASESTEEALHQHRGMEISFLCVRFRCYVWIECEWLGFSVPAAWFGQCQR